MCVPPHTAMAVEPRSIAIIIERGAEPMAAARLERDGIRWSFVPIATAISAE